MAVKKKIENPVSQYILPSENAELEFFIKQFKVEMMEQVVSSIEHAIKNQLPLIEIFQFKNSDFVITVSDKDYLPNLDNIFNYYMSHEVYEHCPRVIELQKTLINEQLKKE